MTVDSLKSDAGGGFTLFAGDGITLEGIDGQVTINASGGSGGIEITDGTHDVTGATKLTVTGGTVGGTTPNATLTISGGGGGIPLPFVGTAPVDGWTRPSLATFSTWLNQGGSAVGVGTDSPPLNGTPVAPGIDNYAPGDTITLAGGTGTATVLTLTDTQIVSATIIAAGTGGVPGSDVVTGTTGTGTMFQLNVTINGGGGIGSIDSIANPGDYTTNPTDPTNEPVTDGAALTGAVVNVVMGALIAAITTPGVYSVPPSNPVSQSASSGTGTGATWNLAFADQANATDNAGGLPLVITGGLDFPTTLSNHSFGFAYPTGKLKSRGAAPWTLTVALAAFSQFWFSPVLFYPIILRNSGSGLASLFSWWGGSAADNGGLAEVLHVTSTVPVITPPTIVGSQNRGFAFPDYFEWFRVINDGTTLTYQVSPDGLLFADIYSESLASFIGSVDQIGFGFDRAIDVNFFEAGLETNAILWQWVET